MRIAVIGAGVSGCLVARLLATRHDVTLLEAGDHAGGHANTVQVECGGRQVPVDVGFMVFNRRTYPNFCRLLRMLKVRSQRSDMSFSVCDQPHHLEYQGSSLNGLFAQRRNLARPDFLRMLRDIGRFNRHAMHAVGRGSLPRDLTVGQFLADCRVGSRFMESYFLPMASAIWSCGPGDILQFPAQFMLGFCANHGLLQLRDRPQWRTVVEGSRRYVEELLTPIRSAVRLNCPVEAIRRSGHGIEVDSAAASHEAFDHVVFATHADQTLRMLVDASPAECEVLSAFPYLPKEAYLHTDTSVLPSRERAWASWNYRVPRGSVAQPTVTYDLRRLQRLPLSEPLLLTLNDASEIAPGKILRSFQFTHPAYSVESLAAQARHAEISGVRRTHFCGAYWGYGFHEDGVNSALSVAAAFGIGLEACKAVCTKAS